jgi:hypothetical protein
VKEFSPLCAAFCPRADVVCDLGSLFALEHRSTPDPGHAILYGYCDPGMCYADFLSKTPSDSFGDSHHLYREGLYSHTSYGRGAGVGRGLGVGSHLPVHGVGVGVGVAAGVSLGVAVGGGVSVGVGTGMSLAVGVGEALGELAEH